MPGASSAVRHVDGAVQDRPRLLLLGSGLTVVLTAVAATLGIGSFSSNAAADGLVRALMVATPMIIALNALHEGTHRRYAALLYAGGIVAFLSTFADSDNAAVYTIGRASGWWLQLAVLVLILTYPSGRLAAGIDRRLLTGAVAVVLVFYMPLLLVVREFQVPSPYTSCLAHCPHNALFFLDHEPRVLSGMLRAGGSLMAAILMAFVALRLFRRAEAATPAMRRTMSPMFFVGVGETALLAIAFPLRALFDDAGFVEGVMWLLALSLPATAIAFFAGLLRSRLFAGRALRRLAWTVQSRPSGHVLRRAIAETLEDPTTDILFLTGNAGSRWTDADGEEATLPRDDAAREIHFVRDGSAVAGAIVYGANAGLNPQLLDAASGLAAVAIANQRLQVDAESALRDARQSRERMVSTADRERRRLERDLHDGAQQRLVALRIELGLLEETVTTDPEHAVERIRELQEAADEALEELRALGHGILPPLLADRGLREALRATAARCTLPVDLRTRDLTRYPPEIESTVYFCVLEALQNAEKHALGAQHIVVELDGSGPREIRFLIYDDGQGASEEAFADGAGMTNMRDRLGALGGEVRIASSRGIGTSVRAWVPTTRPV